MWQGQEVASVAAETEEIAKDATRKIKVQYEVLPHLVREEDLAKAGARAKPAGEQVKGDPDKAFQEADAVVEGPLRHPGHHALLPGAASATPSSGRATT